MNDRCAGCGKEWTATACCSRAYWSKHAPLPRDSWYPTTVIDGWHLYGWALPQEIAPVNWWPDRDKG